MKHYLFAQCIPSPPQVKSARLFSQVQKHLSKLFDNIAEMRFETDGEGNPSKIGLGMYSKEEEYVPFSHCCECTGQVNELVIFKGHIHFFRVQIGLIVTPNVGQL